MKASTKLVTSAIIAGLIGGSAALVNSAKANDDKGGAAKAEGKETACKGKKGCKHKGKCKAEKKHSEAAEHAEGAEHHDAPKAEEAPKH